MKHIIYKDFFFRLKRVLLRESFKNLNITKTLSTTLMNLNDTVLNKKEFYKIRTIVFEIIALIWIDDFHDNYLDSLEALCANIKHECFSNKGLTKVAYSKNYL